MKVVVTGAEGFIARNLRQRLSARGDITIACFDRRSQPSELPALVAEADFVFHLAGVNRSEHREDFVAGNVSLTHALCEAVGEAAASGRAKPAVVFASSTHADRDTDYGRSKRAAEEALFALAEAHGIAVHVFRLANVFGKWCRPNYNSAVATFCHNLARGLPVVVHDANAALTLIHIDDVVDRLAELLDSAPEGSRVYRSVSPQYPTTVGEVAALLGRFARADGMLDPDDVGSGLGRALHATYLSYLSSARGEE